MAKATNWRQKFFEDVPEIRLLDPLAALLGAIEEDEPLVYTYKDAVKLAGHSCPAVSGAYTLTSLALRALYGTELPIRGQIRVLIKGEPTQLAYGPQSQVIMLITGASTITGFKGLGGRFSRQNLLHFDEADFQFSTFIFQREDTGATIKVVYDTGALPDDNILSELSPKVIQGIASEDDKELFIEHWEGKVENILLHHDDFPGLFKLEELKDFTFPKAE